MKDTRPIKLVLGGSFNPPTLAHRDLALQAAESVAKITGRMTDPLFVPSSDAYVRRKMSKETIHGLVFTERARLDMCLALLDGYGGGTDDIEFGDDGRGRTYETMRKLQDADPDNEYMFLAGADKLRIIPRWHEIRKFLSEFRIAVTARHGADATRILKSDPVLGAYPGSFLVIPDMRGPHAGYSSTEARRLIEEGVNLDDAAEICGYGVTKIIEKETRAGRVPDLAKAGAKA